MVRELTIQLGKNGVTENFFNTLRTYFKYNIGVKVIVLQNFPDRTKEKVKEIAKEITKVLGENYSCKTIGFTIAVKKWKKNQEKIALRLKQEPKWAHILLKKMNKNSKKKVVRFRDTLEKED